MVTLIKIPSPGESITQVVIASWLLKEGDFVEINSEIAEIESDKATLAIYAGQSGVLKILVQEGATVNVGDVIGEIHPSDNNYIKPLSVSENINKDEQNHKVIEKNHTVVSPLAKKLIAEKSLNSDEIVHATKSSRILRKTVALFLQQQNTDSSSANLSEVNSERTTSRIKMSPLRIKLAERLVAVKKQTAMLTTFNEVNMSSYMIFKKQFGAAFKEKSGFSPGIVSFFTMVASVALREYAVVNASVDGEDIVYHDYTDINIAVSSPKGLITPLIKDVQKLNVLDVELKIRDFAQKAAKNRILPDELISGTFTITNGGVFGSMMSTPIINPPQSAILGLHKISERPVVCDGKIIAAPVMFIALSYDHRLIDGKESVGFVVKVKELMEQNTEDVFYSEAAEKFEAYLKS